MKNKTRQIELLESREMMDGFGAYLNPPIPISDADVHAVAKIEAIEPIPLPFIGGVPTDIPKTASASRAVYSFDTVVVEATSGSPQDVFDFKFNEYNLETKRLNMSWSPSENAIGYVIQYQINNDDTWTLAWYSVGRNNRQSIGVEPDRVYNYRVAAFNEYGQSAWTYGTWSYEESIKPQKPGPISFDSYDPETKSLTYSWGCVDGKTDGYWQCDYSVDGGKTWKTASNVKWNRVERTATKVELGTMFRVYNKLSDGSLSNPVEITWEGVLTVKA